MKRNKHSLSHYKLFSCDMGELIPAGMVEVLPGDTFQHATSALVRVSPLLAPVMHPVNVRIHHWYVPYRILWEDFEDFITGGGDGFATPTFPTKSLGASSRPVGSLADYLGVPTSAGSNNLVHSALPYRAYALIYNEWYRDQDLTDPVPFSTISGNDGAGQTNSSLLNCAWERDYFTSARPWTQKGPEVQIPLTGDADVVSAGDGVPNFVGDDTGIANVFNLGIDAQEFIKGEGGPINETLVWNDPKLQADLSSVSATNINELRLAFALQRYQEARARYGSRYTEYLRYLGIRSSDARLQRPEYLGGGKQTIQFSEVLQTAPGAAAVEQFATNSVGSLKGHGITAVRSNRYRRYFEEHGLVMTLMSVRPKTMYTQGLHKLWNRRTKEDFWQKELEHIGQEEIQNKEIYVGNDRTADEETFGFQDRYENYRRIPSSVAGEFRTPALSFWHMARDFAEAPVLNDSFVTSVPTKRVHAEQSSDVLWIMAQHSIQARRLVAKTGKSYIY